MSENHKSNNVAWLVTGLGFAALAGRSGRETREAIVAEADRGRK